MFNNRDSRRPLLSENAIEYKAQQEYQQIVNQLQTIQSIPFRRIYEDLKIKYQDDNTVDSLLLEIKQLRFDRNEVIEMNDENLVLVWKLKVNKR